MSVITALQTANQIVQLGKDVVPLVASFIDKAKQLNPGTARRIALDRSLAVMDEELAKQKFAAAIQK